MQKTNYDSYLHGTLPVGCKHCVKGEKLVLFITGICPRKCSFCPISDDKNQKDIIFADEWEIKNFHQHFHNIIKEAELIKAKGAGITGGDPLTRIKRTTEAIKKLKSHFGKNFHIHLYTSLDLVTENILKKLHEAGLDEIRFHLDIDDDALWKKLDLAKLFDWDVGVEIPVIPKKLAQYKKIINFIKGKVKFLNLNELEIPDNSFSTIKGVKPKNNISYAAKGSENLALKLLKYVEGKNIKLSVHYCTARLKDAHQLANRLKRRALGVANAFDKIDEDGLFHRGAIYLEELKPGVGYRKKIKNLTSYQKKSILSKLKSLEKFLKKKRFKKGMYIIDENKYRIISSEGMVKLHKKELKNLDYFPALVVEYPTHDQLEIEIDFI